MPAIRRRFSHSALGILAAAASAMPATAQTLTFGGGGSGGVRDPRPRTAAEREDYFQQINAARRDAEQRLRLIRSRYFDRAGPDSPNRDIGVRELKRFTDPGALAVMIDVFRRTDADARGVVLDHIASIGTEEADATLAWEAVFAESKTWRGAARARLVRRVRERGLVPLMIRDVLANGLAVRDTEPIEAAASLADQLNIGGLIPSMINAQVVQRSTGAAGSASGRGRTGDLAYIFIGRQEAFVSDVRPIVAGGAVAFDPQVDVISSGVILRVQDAVVTLAFYPAVRRSLVNLTSRLTGESTDHLGYDQQAWAAWYRDEFLPRMIARGAAAYLNS